ncbi:lipoyl synthase [Nocardioides humi]|uniref:Lipoyl synthase n=1 Tax=Nocardioides humi TaxID=449461 RepID=A0ABN2AGR7_9ACTN|nr:lipoyl synthase [Nocardioides humi]
MNSQNDVGPNGRRLLPLATTDNQRRAGVVRSRIDTSRNTDVRPPWIKVTATQGAEYRDLSQLVRGKSLNTVCQQAACPNIFECWEQREVSFIVGGEDCTRRCAFCQIRTGKPGPLDRDEPRRLGAAVSYLRLNFVVVTMVARDDLHDGGAWLIAECIRQIRSQSPDCGIEVLPSDFGYARNPERGGESLRTVVDAAPDVFAFNLETTRRLFSDIRPAFDYERSLEYLALARELMPTSTAIKSNIIVGMGETDEEVFDCLRDLRQAGVSLVTIGQYLQPSDGHLRVDRYVTPEQFAAYRTHGLDLGLAHIEAGPLVRSSYHAGDQAESAKAWAR